MIKPGQAHARSNRGSAEVPADPGPTGKPGGGLGARARRTARERRAEGLIAGRRLLEADDVERLAEKIDASRRVRELHRELQALPEGERAVLELVAVDGLTVAEAAAALGIRPVTARVRLHRARRALRPEPFQMVIETEVLS